jgi:tetratricopeptide (TPR) repeat protein
MKKIFLVTVITILCMAPRTGVAQGSRDMQKQRFVDAGEAYQKGQYERAIALYEKILAAGFEGGHVYFNLGNSYFKIGEYGEARLNYERAFRFIPRDHELRFNYEFLLSFLAIKEYNETNWAYRAFARFVRGITVNELAVMLLVIVLAVCVLSIVSLARQWSRRTKRVWGLISGLLVATLLSGLAHKFHLRDNAIVLQKAKAKFEPKEASTTHFQLAEGAKVRWVRQEDGWVKVRRGDAKLGWMRKDELQKIYQ